MKTESSCLSCYTGPGFDCLLILNWYHTYNCYKSQANVHVVIQYETMLHFLNKFVFFKITLMKAKTMNNRRWDRHGAEGIQLKKDILEGIKDSTLNVKNPDYMSLWNREVHYQRFSKETFRNHVRHALQAYTTACASSKAKSKCKNKQYLVQCYSVLFVNSMQTVTEHGKAFISDDPDEKDDNNHDIEDLEEEFESTQLSEFPAIIFPS